MDQDLGGGIMKIGAIKQYAKTGEESLTDIGNPIGFSLLDFWRWSVSDLMSNATRGKFAEFIVATAVGYDKTKCREEWASYDLVTPDGIKIEVKSSAYLQSWAQKDYSKIVFSIKKSLYWDSESGQNGMISNRWADVYVFCFLKHKDQDSVDPLNMDMWEFYVLSTKVLNGYTRSQSSITLNTLRGKTDKVDYAELNDKIHQACSPNIV